MSETAATPVRTPLYELHLEHGGKMMPFAGYELPVQYSAGIKAEHLHTREAASLFDVSHMGQVRVDGAERVAALESILPADIAAIPEQAIKYSFFTNEAGGILDDLMITNRGESILLVLNAACKQADIQHLRKALAGRAELTELDDLALLALQGPKAAEVLARFAPGIDHIPFMTSASLEIEGAACQASRSGYTGEDGYEISLAAEDATRVAKRLLSEAEVEPAGLGARDSLRLEAGLCLYGHDIDETTSPVEAALTWAIPKRRRQEGGFPGAAVVQRQLAEGAPRKRVGILPEGRAPVREGAEILSTEGASIGQVTSGGFGPSLGGPMAMGYVAKAQSAVGTQLLVVVRGKELPCKVILLPFVKQNYYRG